MPPAISQAARDAWQHALTIFDQLGHSEAEQVRAKLHQLDQPAPSDDTATDDQTGNDTEPA